METVFLAFGYRNQEPELASQVERLLESHDIKVMTGEVHEGQELTERVKNLISQTDALVAVLAPREPAQSGGYRTSTWVRDELQHARSIRKETLAFSHHEVVTEGLNAGAGRIDYDPDNLAPAFLRLSTEIGALKRSLGKRVKVRILPTDIEQEIALNGSRCRYLLTQESDGTRIREWDETEVHLEPGGAFAYLNGVRRDAFIQMEVLLGQPWRSRATPQWLHVECRRGT